jgi:hypothetical protein
MDSRRVLQQALARLARTGHGLKVGLEVEFHVYRLLDASPQLDPELAAWPGLPPRVEMIHPGYQLQGEAMTDMAEPVLRIVQDTAQALGLPLQSLEIELGPSQIEAVFDATDALTAADQMVLFRNGVRQALRRAGYLATFMCRPPFPNVMSSGWHLHQSLVRLDGAANAFARASSAPGTDGQDASHTLSDTGCQWLAGLLAHAEALACLCTPTANGFGRFRPNALAPKSAVWGRDNRGAMLRVVGAAGDPATRIENRLGEPAANPYLYMASQIVAGLDGVQRGLTPPRASENPYDPGHPADPGHTVGCAGRPAGRQRADRRSRTDSHGAFSAHQARRSCRATPKPRTSWNSTAANTSAASDPSSACDHDHHPVHRPRRQGTDPACHPRPEPDEGRHRRQHPGHRGRLRRHPHLRHLPRHDRRALGRPAARAQPRRNRHARLCRQPGPAHQPPELPGHAQVPSSTAWWCGCPPAS